MEAVDSLPTVPAVFKFVTLCLSLSVILMLSEITVSRTLLPIKSGFDRSESSVYSIAGCSLGNSTESRYRVDIL